MISKIKVFLILSISIISGISCSKCFQRGINCNASPLIFKAQDSKHVTVLTAK